jgi:hypothetical protein
MFLALVGLGRAAGERSALVNQSSAGVAIEGYDPRSQFQGYRKLAEFHRV